MFGKLAFVDKNKIQTAFLNCKLLNQFLVFVQLHMFTRVTWSFFVTRSLSPFSFKEVIRRAMCRYSYVRGTQKVSKPPPTLGHRPRAGHQVYRSAVM